MTSPHIKDMVAPLPGPQLIWTANGFAVSSADWSALTTVDINGVTFTIDNDSSWAAFGPDGNGNLEMSISSGHQYGNGSFNSPILRASLDSLLGETPSAEDTYIWRMLLASTNGDPTSGDEGIGLGIRTTAAGDAGKDVGTLWKRDNGGGTVALRFPNTTVEHGSAVSGVRVLSVEVIESYFVVTRYSDSLLGGPRGGTRSHRGIADTTEVSSNPSSSHMDIASADCWVSGWGASSPSTFVISDLQLWKETAS